MEVSIVHPGGSYTLRSPLHRNSRQYRSRTCIFKHSTKRQLPPKFHRDHVFPETYLWNFTNISFSFLRKLSHFHSILRNSNPRSKISRPSETFRFKRRRRCRMCSHFTGMSTKYLRYNWYLVCRRYLVENETAGAFHKYSEGSLRKIPFLPKHRWSGFMFVFQRAVRIFLKIMKTGSCHSPSRISQRFCFHWEVTKQFRMWKFKASFLSYRFPRSYIPKAITTHWSIVLLFSEHIVVFGTKT